jgi:hypothetical protein
MTHYDPGNSIVKKNGSGRRLPAPWAISSPGCKTKLVTANKPVLTPLVLEVLMLCSHLVVESCNTLLLVNSRRSDQQSLEVVPPTSWFHIREGLLRTNAVVIALQTVALLLYNKRLQENCNILPSKTFPAKLVTNCYFHFAHINVSKLDDLWT